MIIAAELLQQAYVDACRLDTAAFKPGNVSVYAAGHDMTVAQFHRSAAVSAPCLVAAGHSLGERIYRAIAATRAAVGCNTNLGIVLLAAPLLVAAETAGTADLRERLGEVLANTTQRDAEWVYQAIRVAAPGGLGEASQADVRDAPPVNLRAAMAIAAERDRIAYQYVTNYADVFDAGLREFHAAQARFGSPAWALVVVFAHLLAHLPDSHVERKYGAYYRSWLQVRFSGLYQFLQRSEAVERLPLLYALDAELKSLKINPGTTADLTVAVALAVNLQRLVANGIVKDVI